MTNLLALNGSGLALLGGLLRLLALLEKRLRDEDLVLSGDGTAAVTSVWPFRKVVKKK
jgi:malic enzyme